MGWASGSQLAENLWEELYEHIDTKERSRLARLIYEMFCDQDADDWNLDSQLCLDAGITEEYDNDE